MIIANFLSLFEILLIEDDMTTMIGHFDLELNQFLSRNFNNKICASDSNISVSNFSSEKDMCQPLNAL